ncbi:MAG: DedA family protein [Bacteroidia bacterium]|nr:DedA family protein [Bacteroidia bacterium]
MSYLHNLGYLGLFLACFLSATIIPFSSEAILSAAILSGYNIFLSIILASLGNWLGGMSSYFIGYLGKPEWISKYLRIKPERAEKMMLFLQKRGAYFAFFSWVPFVGDIIAVALGLMRCNAFKVGAYMFAGKTTRYIVWAYLTFEVGKHWGI